MNKTILGVVGAGILISGIILFYFIVNNNSNERVLTPAESFTPQESSDAQIKIIAFGDSLTAGYGVSQNEAYPAQLEEALRQEGYDVSIINSGVSGETTRGNLERAEFIRDQDSKIVLLGIGGNDALRVLPVEETEENIRKTIDILQDTPEPPIIILLEMQAPINAGLRYKRNFDDLYNRVASEKELLLIPFISTKIFEDETNKLADGIHYNALGYKKVIDQYMAPALEDVLKNL